MDASGEDYRILVMPDHPTPIRARTHTSDPVPYVFYDSTAERKAVRPFNEREAAATGNLVTNGYELMERFVR